MEFCRDELIAIIEQLRVQLKGAQKLIATFTGDTCREDDAAPRRLV
jgi:hypothetical protein